MGAQRRWGGWGWSSHDDAEVHGDPRGGHRDRRRASRRPTRRPGGDDDRNPPRNGQRGGAVMKILAIATAGAALTVSAVAWAAAPNVPAMHAFGRWAAQRGPKDVTYLLDQGFRSGGYNSALKALAK